MARAPDERYDKAYELFKSGKKLIEIANQLNLPEGTVRRWKSTHNWENERSEKRSERSENKKKKNQHIAKEVKQVIDNPELTDKQRLFCIYYVKSFNAAQSYTKAYGCSYESALVNGSRLLTNDNIRAEIQALKELKLQQIAAGEEDLIDIHMRIAFADIGNYVEFGRKTIDTEEGLSFEINDVRLHESTMVDTQLIKEVSKNDKGAVSIKLLDRCKSLDWLDRYFLMNPMDKHKIEYDNKKLELARAKAQLSDNEEQTEDDGFLEALAGKVDEIWSEE